MNVKLLSLIPDYLLGVLPDSQRYEIDALVAGSSAFRQEVDRVAESLALGDPLAGEAPPEAVRGRLLRTLGGVDRFEHEVATTMSDEVRRRLFAVAREGAG